MYKEVVDQMTLTNTLFKVLKLSNITLNLHQQQKLYQ